jgi:hypothetical protein
MNGSPTLTALHRLADRLLDAIERAMDALEELVQLTEAEAGENVEGEAP